MKGKRFHLDVLHLWQDIWTLEGYPHAAIDEALKASPHFRFVGLSPDYLTEETVQILSTKPYLQRRHSTVMAFQAPTCPVRSESRSKQQPSSMFPEIRELSVERELLIRLPRDIFMWSSVGVAACQPRCQGFYDRHGYLPTIDFLELCSVTGPLRCVADARPPFRQ